MEFRLKTWVIWLQAVLVLCLGASSALDAFRRTEGLRVYSIVVAALIGIIAVVWIVRSARQVRPRTCVLRVSKEGVTIAIPGRDVPISWEEIRSAGRPRPWDEKAFAPLARAHEISGDLKRRFGVTFQHEDVLPDLLAFYARNPQLLPELSDRDALDRRMRGLRHRIARRARAHERKLGTVRFGRKRPEVTESGRLA